MAEVKTVTSKKGKKEKKEKVGRSVYDYSSAIDADGNSIVKNGKLLSVPVTIPGSGDEPLQVGYNPKKHVPLKDVDFASQPAFLRYRADGIQAKAEVLAATANGLRAKAERFEKFGDDAT